ncbi:DUF86 domain-containing protein [Planctomycetota bacterium]
MRPSPIELLRHIRDEADYLLRKSEDLSKDQFTGDETLIRAFIRSLEIIGEAVKGLPDEIRQEHPSIEWRLIGRMRDKLIHGYFGVDLDIVWDVVTDKVPILYKTIQAILDQEKPD